MSRRLSWGLEALGIEALWGRGVSGSGVLVGHLDTGIGAEHPALEGRLDAFIEFDELGEPISGQEPRDSAGHGTHTAGIVCGGIICNEVIGTAPGARLASAAVIDDGNNVVRILRGLSWLRGRGARVLCMALGIPGNNPIFWTMLSALRAEGMLLVCPIGNHGSSISHAPGNYPQVLSVGALDREGSFISSTGCLVDAEGRCLKPDVLAPGFDIPSASAFSNSSLAKRSGTSQACAFVAGVAALLFQAFPRATADELAWALRQSARAVDTRKGLRYRFGGLDVKQALHLMEQGPSEPLEPHVDEPPFFRDPHLLDALRTEASDAWHDCVMITVGDMDARGDPRGSAGQVVDFITEEAGEAPRLSGYIPEGRVGWVRASKRFVQALVRCPEVLVLSSARARNPGSLIFF